MHLRDRALYVPLSLLVAALLLATWLAWQPDRDRRAIPRPTTLVNPSLGADRNGDGVPDCWARALRGSSTGTYTRSRLGQSGRYAETVTVTRLTSGARSLQIDRTRPCFLDVTSRHVYRIGVWYRGHGALYLTAFYRASDGTWRQWVSSPRLSPASGFTLVRFDTPPAPWGVTGAVFGLELRSAGVVVTDDYSFHDHGTPISVHREPPAQGYFPTLVAPARWRSLPGDLACAARVHRSTWEPRPSNTGHNHLLVDPGAVHASFRSRPRAGDGGYSPLWDSWLLPRVDGQFSGTTDEILQWAACKWGLPDNFLRAEADAESTWFQSEVYRGGRCVDLYGCGDFFTTEPAAARDEYCARLAATGGYDYQRDFGTGQCPKTFSIVGIMSWWNPAWGYHWARNQNGTFPFTRDSTAVAVDFMASQIRGCYQGWEWQLGGSYQAGDLWGCAGAWYSGGWHDAPAQRYIAKVQASLNNRPWLAPGYAREHGPCQPDLGCPVHD